MMIFMLSISWTMSIMFLFMTHPLSFGLVLLIQTFLISLITGMMNSSFWFSYILFLIMVGSMLILFIYMTSIASNEKFLFSHKIFIITTISLMLSIILMIPDSYLSTNANINDLMSQDNFVSNQYSLTKYLNWPTNMILVLIITYLFITLIMVVKITNIKYGPLRQKF